MITSNSRYVRPSAENKAKQLNHFEVQFGNAKEDGQKMTTCSEYPFRTPGAGRAMRMNCEPTHRLFSEVQLNSQYNRGLDIAEIELHTLGKFSWLVKFLLITSQAGASTGGANDAPG